MARKKKSVPQVNSSSTADIAFYFAYLLPYHYFYGYGPRLGKTSSKPTRSKSEEER